VLVRADRTSSSPDYSPLVVDHFDQPRNVGRLEPAPGVITARAGKREQGAEFMVSAHVTGERIAAARFEVYGCPHCIAAASWLSERLVGGTLADLEAWSWREAVAALQIPPEKRGRLLILEDALRALAVAWRQQS
jgi:NifU-like protein involved in Fe-S cluster formation